MRLVILIISVLLLTACSTLKVDSKFTKKIVIEKQNKQEKIYIIFNNPISYRLNVDRLKVKEKIYRLLEKKGYIIVNDKNSSDISIRVVLFNMKQSKREDHNSFDFHKAMGKIAQVLNRASEKVDTSTIDTNLIDVFTFYINIEIERTKKSQSKLTIEISKNGLNKNVALEVFENRLPKEIANLF